MTLIYFLLILTLIVTIHELGHFIFAKKAGIYCYEFSIGMGPRIFKFKRKNDETTYSIRLLPIGGFVQMAGESVDMDKDIPRERNMQSKTWLQRFLTIIAGVLFNFILALIILFGIALVNGAPSNTPYVGVVEENYPAYESGLKTGDKILSINGKNIKTTDRLLLELAVYNGKGIKLEVKRNEKIEEFIINPIKEEDTYRYGFGLGEKTETGFLASVKYAFLKTGSLVSQMFMIITYLVTGKLGLNSLSGPIGIYTIVGETAKTGIINILYLISLISINVGFINLIPLPAFDGGRLLFLLIEKIKGSPVSPKIENTIHAIGFILLMILMVVITGNDIIRIFS